MQTKTMKQWMAAAAVGVVLAGPVALAGDRIVLPVVINTVARKAEGAIGSARNSADVLQYIGCSISATTVGTSINCVARNSAGTQVSCSSTSPNLVTAALSIQTDDFLRFDYDAAGQCTAVTLHKYSFYEPKAP
ncbi:hypothetical protein [Pyxidicoccus trucidator]|uniref:hypothetical protein n=1 Tax=Pyxidicoccus trucidator TaxID=2709662 RepID=UPI0013D954ED|nr:hypothetical protein [Pyxidicoccus trucidator]